MSSLSGESRRVQRAERNKFLESLSVFRPDLYRFCRKLAKNPFDAEDLVQETILRVYGRFADAHLGIASPRSYLFKTASHLWFDEIKRSKRFVAEEIENSQEQLNEALVDAGSAIGWMFERLPPKERVAYILSEAFDFKLDEIADITQSSVASVKMALGRGRGKVVPEQNEIKPSLSFKSLNSDLIDAAVAAFNARDLIKMTALFLTSATAVGPGCFVENGLDEIKRGSLFYTFNTHDGQPQPESYKAKRIELFGESYFALYNCDELDDIWRFDVEDGLFSNFICYYCSPELLLEMAEALGARVRRHGYFFEDKSG